MSGVRKMRAQRSLFMILLCAVFISGALAEDMPIADDGLLTTSDSEMESAPDELIFNVPPAKPAEGAYSMDAADDIPFQSIHIRAVGDLMVHQRQLDVAKQEDGTYDFHDMYSYVAESLSNADLTIGNLETTINTADTKYRGYPTFNSPVSLLDTLKDVGIDFLTLANNHMLDTRFEGMCSTVTQVEEYGFVHAGAFRTKEEKEVPVLMEINGIHIGFLSYTDLINGMEKYSGKAALEYGVSYLKKADIKEQVQVLKDAGAELVICMPHWGIEYKRHHNATQEAWARRMIEAGVDVVLGSHPHMVQPIEWLTVETEDGERTGLVAWSLGNFVSNMSNQYTDSGIILDFTVIKDMAGNITISDVGYVPIYVWRTASFIRAVCSGQFLMEQPEGMSDETWSRMRISWSELIALLGTEFEILDK